MTTREFRLAAVVLLLAAFSAIPPESSGQIEERYELVYPPESVGADPTTSEPSDLWAHYGNYSTEQECETARRIGMIGMFDSDEGERVIPVPASAACVPLSVLYAPRAPRD